MTSSYHFSVKASMLLATADSAECRSFTGGSLCLGDCDPSSCFTSISWLPQLFLGNHTFASITIAHWRGIFYGFYFFVFYISQTTRLYFKQLACKYGWSLACLLPARHSHSFSFGRCWRPSWEWYSTTVGTLFQWTNTCDQTLPTLFCSA